MLNKLNIFKIYQPLFVIVILLAAASFKGAVDNHSYMLNFMAGFFIIFAAFKLFNLKAFQEAYEKYDILAQRYRWYGFLYPFIELSLGFSFLFRFCVTAMLLITALVMLIGCIGVIIAIIKRKQVTCACLGAGFNLPLSKVTLIENISMMVMAIWMLT